jgi:hypothetical protein
MDPNQANQVNQVTQETVPITTDPNNINNVPKVTGGKCGGVWPFQNSDCYLSHESGVVIKQDANCLKVKDADGNENWQVKFPTTGWTETQTATSVFTVDTLPDEDKEKVLKSECDKYAPEETADVVDDNTGMMDTDAAVPVAGLESTPPMEATPFQPASVSPVETTPSPFGAPQPVTTSPFEPKPAFGNATPSPFEAKPAFETPAPSPFATRGFGGKRRYKSKKNLNKRSRQTRKRRGGNKTSVAPVPVTGTVPKI